MQASLAQLNGSYTIGGTTPDYMTITDADFACENNTIGMQNINLSPSFANCGLGLCSSLRIPVNVVVLPGVNVNLGNDTSIAIPFSHTLDAGSGFTNYLQSDNSTGQTLTATQSGTYWVTVTGGNGCSFTDSININVSVGISQTLNQDLITIYPNPVNKILHVELADGLHADFLNIIDLNGHIILEQKINNQHGLNTFSVDVHDYVPGIYFLRIVGKENIIIEKLFIQPN